MFFIMLSSIIYAFPFFATSAHAIPLKLGMRLEARDVVDPPVTYPTAGTVWYPGQTQTVTWDLSALPPNTNITGVKGLLVLGYNTWENENLMIDSPLATDFYMQDGKVTITVPDVENRENYIVCLLGDTGNISQNFTIACSSSAPTSLSGTFDFNSWLLGPTSSSTASGVLAVPPSAASSAASSASVVLTTQIVTSTSMTTVVGPSSNPGISQLSSATSVPVEASSAVILSSTSAPASGTSSSSVSDTTGKPSNNAASGAWSWKKVDALRPWLPALAGVAVLVML